MNDHLRLCIAGTHSGCGKTTVSLGIMAALVKRGLTVQPFKVGPDFIDPGHHRRITGRDSHNLDGWIMDQKMNREIFLRYAADADAAVVEGVMGIFDGFSGNDEKGSTAQMAKWLGLSTVLVINAGSMARSAAALALGFSSYDPDLPLRGVIFNGVGGPLHENILHEAMAPLKHIPVLGCLPMDTGIEIPSRHLGLVTDEDYMPEDDRVERLALWIEDNVNLDQILARQEERAVSTSQIRRFPEASVRIGIAVDEAFCFYYPENLRLIRMSGAELVPFSPLRSRGLPKGISGLILGGGYPELHCAALSHNTGLLKEIRSAGLNGVPIYAECGGFMYLMETIRDFDGNIFPMAGIFPMTAKMENRLMSLGYRQIVTNAASLLGPAGTMVRGHEFHFSRIESERMNPNQIYSVKDNRDMLKEGAGFINHRVLGSYVHLHWGSNPGVAENFVTYCHRHGNA